VGKSVGWVVRCGYCGKLAITDNENGSCFVCGYWDLLIVERI